MEVGVAEENWRNIGVAETLYRDQPPLLYSWIYSPLGRYGFDIQVEETNSEIRDTRDFTHRYFICSLETGTWTEYRANTGLFKSLKATYWLTEDKLVVTDFSRYSGCVRQHILELDHKKKEVNCQSTRSYSWDVDEVHRFKGSNANAVRYKGSAYMAITGYSEDQWQWVRCRLLPFYPLSSNTPLELVIRIEAISETLETHDRFYRNLQPFCCGSRLLFRLSQDFDFIGRFEPAYPLPNVYFTVDMDKIDLDKDGVAWIGMPEESFGLMKLPTPGFAPENNNFTHYTWNNDEYIVNWYQFKGKEPSDGEDANSEPKDCEVFIANLGESTVTRMQFQMKWHDWLTMHPSGALLHWRQTTDSRLECLNRPRPLIRTPTLFNLSKQRLLMTNSHEANDHFINSLIFQ